MAARVKAVLSGDTLVLTDKSGKEQLLSLAYVGSPRLTQTSNEIFGFDSREYLRNLVIGKPVNFRILYEANSRPYGDVSSPIFTSLIEHMLFQGWTRLRDDASIKPEYASYDGRLETAETTASSAHRGVWSLQKPKPIRIWSDVPQALYGSGRTVPSVVEKVVAGDRISLRSMLSSEEHYVGPAALGGIRCQRSGSGDAFGDAAAAFVSSRLLHRSQVRAIYHAPSPRNDDIPLVTLTHPAGDIALLLVTQGLATVNENHVAVGSERLLQLRAAQREAEAAGRNIWKAAATAKAERAAQFESKGFESVVVKVLSSDTVVLENDKIVQLSSVRAPRRGDDPAIANDAREFMRKLLIGKAVNVAVDGETTTAKGDKRLLATLSYGPSLAKNAALDVISSGWATATRHRRDDLDRSPFYEELLAAEELAISKNKGMHAPPSKKKVAAVVDASESAVRARGYLAALERRGRIPAILDLVISAGRYRIAVPSENCTLTAVLDGIRSPRAGEEHADTALAFVNKGWNQRDIQLSVRSVDKTGAFVSLITMGGKSLATELLAEGFATVHEGAANAANLRQEFDDAQEKARNARKGVWSNYEEIESSNIEEPAASDADTPAATNTQPTYQDAVITHVTRDAVYYRLAAAQAKHSQLVSELKTFFSGPTNADKRQFNRRPKRGDSVVSSDYERGSIDSFDRSTNQFEVFLVDAGTSIKVSQDQIYPLPIQFGLSKAPALARQAALRFVHAPVALFEKSYLEYIGKYVGEAIAIYGNDTIYTADSKSAADSLNWRLVSEAYAAVPESQSSDPEAKPFLEAQEQARVERRGMWQYGDLREDDDL